ncbi:hypothetical protein OAR83_02615 [Alphaproteobacteria bacterium]|nr:hypothetical protein [Alphaproteobacteria bacterium]
MVSAPVIFTKWDIWLMNSLVATPSGMSANLGYRPCGKPTTR